ncbi:hypothetical protein C8R32_10864 [Nitrosospira sp. Nsp5]|uniref:Uncharacterized protein n=1 Tax=Nitrosospira multiformis TaxID=1231 RepID=A0ABY0TBM2_9PROT|nr:MULTISPECIES: hypothetical protein [Nitrosospira]PTR07108.1 hypothetical protein C8R32_10864 [Nitrosospira sp. Nsp5]SDQ33712.1 hypothetical protein SAMN05216402_0442 [Nitrosospira multiformis]
MSISRYIETSLPPGPERDQIIGLVNLGLSFQQQQNKGRRPGPLKAYLLKLIQKIDGPVSFDRLLEELELEAVRRDMHGTAASPIEQVNRVWAIVTYHHPRNGRQQLTFKTIRNKLTWCKLNQNK